MLESIQDIDTSFVNTLQQLEDTYGKVELVDIEKGIDLSTPDGIRAARQSLAGVSATMDGFAAAREAQWTAFHDLAIHGDLAEPEASGLRASQSADEVAISNLRIYFSATHAEIIAFGHLIDIAEPHLGKLQWQNNRLIATDQGAASDLLVAQNAFDDARRNTDNTGRAALDRGNHTAKFVLSALRQLEESMPRRDVAPAASK